MYGGSRKGNVEPPEPEPDDSDFQCRPGQGIEPWPLEASVAVPRLWWPTGLRSTKLDAAMARAFGLHAERVEGLSAAIERALANRPALLDVLVTPEAVSSDAKSGLAWVPDLQPLAAWDQAERAWRAA